MSFSFVALLALSFPAQSAPPVEAKFAPAELREDLGVLRSALTQLHPGLHRYLSPAEVEAAFATLQARWSEPRTLREAYLDLSETLAKFRCGHTWASFFNQSERVASALFEGSNRVPFAFRWLDGEMIVTASAVDAAGLAPGARVLSIDGVATGAIRDRLLVHARADGSNDAKRLDQLSVHGREPLEAFDVLFSLCFPAAERTQFALELEALDGERTKLAVPALAAAARNERLAARSPALPKSEFPFALDGWTTFAAAPGVVVLRMDTWVAYKTDWDWRGALDTFVDGLVERKVEHLILDLRANEGGNDCGDVLLARCIVEPLALPSTVRHVRYSKTPDDLNPFLDTWDDSFRNWADAARAVERGPALLGPPSLSFLRLRRDADDDPAATLAPSPRPRFPGRLWVLTSATNSSATFQFAATVQRSGLGQLVGSPTGGNQRGINGGCYFFLRLPRTGLEADLPLIAYTPSTPDGRDLPTVPDAGLTPDIVVRTTRQSLASGADLELAAVLERIRAEGATAPSKGR